MNYDEIKTNAVVWLGTTDKEDVYALAIKTAKDNARVYRVEVNKKDRIVTPLTKVDGTLTNEIVKIVKVLFPEFKDSEPDARHDALKKPDFVITGDLNAKLFEMDIPSLTEKTVIKALDEYKINHDDYEYTSASVDNSYSIKELEEEEFTYTKEEQEEFDSICTSTDKYKGQELRHPLLLEELEDGVNNFLLLGEAGVSKTQDVCKAACINNKRLVQLQLGSNMDEGKITSATMPNTKDTTAMFREIKSKLAIAYKFDCYILLDEFFNLPPNIQTYFFEILDGTRRLTLESGEQVKRHPGCKIFATSNIGYAGLSDSNEAILSRFESVHFYKALDKETFCKWVIEDTNFDGNPKCLNKLYECFDNLRNYAVSSNWRTPITYRQVLPFLQSFFKRKGENAMGHFETKFLNRFTYMDINQEELESLKTVAEPWVEELVKAYEGPSKKAKEGFITIAPSADVDAILDKMGDDFTFDSLEEAE